MPMCNGNHRVVKAVRETIAQQIESDEELDASTKERLAGIIRKSKRGY
jgi:hypothetical protein